MLNIAKAVFGGMMLFLGRDLDWLFSVGIGLLVGLKLTALAEAYTPLWMLLLVIIAVGAVGAIPYLVYPDARYLVTGFLFGGFMLSEYANDVLVPFFGTALIGSTWVVFFVGAVIGAILLALTQEWGLILSTALVGAFLIADLFSTQANITRVLIAGGLFILGGIVQVFILRNQQADAI